MIPRLAPLLAATPQYRPTDILIPLAWITLGAIVIVVTAFVIRKKLRDADDEPANTTAFTMSDLRRLKNEGQISDEEFERTKAALIAHSLAAMNQKKPAPGSSSKPDSPERLRTEASALDEVTETDDASDNQNNRRNGPE